MMTILERARKAADAITSEGRINNLPHALTDDLGFWESSLPSILALRTAGEDVAAAAEEVDRRLEQFQNLAVSLVGTERRIAAAQEAGEDAIATEGMRLLECAQLLTLAEAEEISTNLILLLRSADELTGNLPDLQRAVVERISDRVNRSG